MKTPEQWYSELQNEASHGEPVTPMLEFIRNIQQDAIEGKMISPQVVEENDSLRCLLSETSDVLGDVAAFGNCECDIPQGKTCIVCEASMINNKIRELGIIK